MRPNRKLIAGLIALACVSVPMAARAQDSPAAEETTVVVTATRVPSLLSKTPAAVSVVTGDQIRQSGAKTLAEVVALLPGVAVRPQGSLGALNTVSLRGSDGKQVLIMLDGVPMNDQRQGGTDLSLIPVDNIARVEVVRGPASSLYGANALGGVINIITGGAPAKPHFQALAGDHGGREYRLRTSADLAGGRFQLMGGNLSTDGWRKNSQLDAWNGTARIDWTGHGWNTLTASLVSFADKKGLPGQLSFPSPNDRQQDKNNLLSFTGSRKLTDVTDFTGTLYAGRTELDYSSLDWMTNAPYTDVHKSTSFGTQLQFTTRYDAEDTWLYGIDARREQADSTSLKKTVSATTAGFFAEDEAKLAGDDILRVGARLDAHSDYGVQFDPRIGYVHKFTTSSLFRASLGRAFRAPTFNELFWPFTDYGYGMSYKGNPDLKPESAWTLDLGVEQRLGASTAFKATVFDSRVSNLINAGVTMPENVGSAELKGLELEINHRLGRAGTAFVNFTGESARDRATNQSLIRIPKSSVNAGIICPLLRGGSFAATSRWIGKRFDWDFSAYPAKLVEMPTYNLVDLKLTVPASKGIAVTLSLENAFDTQYEAIAGYPMPGRSVQMGLEYQM